MILTKRIDLFKGKGFYAGTYCTVAPPGEYLHCTIRSHSHSALACGSK